MGFLCYFTVLSLGINYYTTNTARANCAYSVSLISYTVFFSMLLVLYY